MFGKVFSWANKKITATFNEVRRLLNKIPTPKTTFVRITTERGDVIEEEGNKLLRINGRLQQIPTTQPGDEITSDLNLKDTVTTVDRFQKSRVIYEIEKLPKNRSSEFYIDSVIKILSDSDRMRQTLDVGSVYVYKYRAKTPGKWYDRNPVTIITDLTSTGWKGYNWHWQGELRTYRYGRELSAYYLVMPGEVDAVLSLPMADIRYVRK
jgi:membrane-associated protease RseP (regulator of RpoE activity)